MSKLIMPLMYAVLAAFWFVAAAAARRQAPSRARLPMIGGALAALVTLALLVIAVAQVTITAAVAIPLFVATIFQFGLLIALASRTFSGRVSHRGFMVGVLTIIAAILTGVVLMFQPITPKPFNLGFDFVLIALLAFNVWSHITPRPREQK